MSKELIKRLQKTSKHVKGQIMSKTDVFDRHKQAPTSIPILNFAMSGRYDGGLAPGITFIAGESKHFKSLYALLWTKAFQDAYPDAPTLFYDSEFGARKNYFGNMGVDMDRVIHKPENIIQHFGSDLYKAIDELEDGEVMSVLVDSLGMMSTLKLVDDIKNETGKKDMTEAQAIRNALKTINLPAVLKGVPVVIVNHTYDTQEMYSKKIMRGGQMATLAAENVWFISKVKERDTDKSLKGFNFKINVNKSRVLKENSAFDVTVMSEDTKGMKKGINRWSGLLQIAEEVGYLEKPKQAHYQRPAGIGEEGEAVHRDNTHSVKFWGPVLKDPEFTRLSQERYCLPTEGLVQDDERDGDVSQEEGSES